MHVYYVCQGWTVVGLVGIIGSIVAKSYYGVLFHVNVLMGKGKFWGSDCNESPLKETIDWMCGVEMRERIKVEPLYGCDYESVRARRLPFISATGLLDENLAGLGLP
jgi:hypothetical protein